MWAGGCGARRSVEGWVFAPWRRVDAATDLQGDTRRAGRESAGTALLDWSIALLWPALAPCLVIFPASVTTAQFIGPDPSPASPCRDTSSTAPARASAPFPAPADRRPRHFQVRAGHSCASR